MATKILKHNTLVSISMTAICVLRSEPIKLTSGSAQPHRLSAPLPLPSILIHPLLRQDVALKTFSKPWDKQFNSIEEEGLLDDDDESEKRIPRRCYVLGFIICFLILFSLFALILYSASKPQKPKLTMRSITFERFVVQAGSDFTGVATDMVTMNSISLVRNNGGKISGGNKCQWWKQMSVVEWGRRRVRN
ncbi:hypothetical protein R6Q59_025297 [Mikania micrantha]